MAKVFVDGMNRDRTYGVWGSGEDREQAIRQYRAEGGSMKVPHTVYTFEVEPAEIGFGPMGTTWRLTEESPDSDPQIERVNWPAQ